MFNRLKMIMAVALSQALSRTPLSLQRIVQNHNRTVDVLRDAASAEPSRPRRRMFEGARRIIPRSRAKGNGYRGPNGAQAMARRVRQGRPTLWADSQGRRWTFNSHGCVVGFGWASGPNNPRGLFY